jgi:hypothetical protein
MGGMLTATMPQVKPFMKKTATTHTLYTHPVAHSAHQPSPLLTSTDRSYPPYPPSGGSTSWRSAGAEIFSSFETASAMKPAQTKH